MVKGKHYRLRTFNGTLKPNEDCESHENYWILIGQFGTLVNFAQDLQFGNDERVLFEFDRGLEKQGLTCHNSIPNALWILKTDLEEKV